MGRLKGNSPFFTIFKDKDEVTLEEIFILCKREEKYKENSQWIYSSLYIWKKRGIAEPIYGSRKQSTGWTRYSSIIGIKLTEDGKNLLGRGTKELQQSQTGEVVESQADAKPIIDPDARYFFEQLIERFPNRKVTLEFDVRRNNKQDLILENARIVVAPVAQ